MTNYTPTKTENQQLAGAATLRWLAGQAPSDGFTLCCGPDHGCSSPGKVPHESEWQHKRHTIAEALAHLARGGNVGHLGSSLVWLDLDAFWPDFLRRFGYEDAPAIVRSDPDRGKLIIRIKGKTTGGRKWKYHNRSRHLCIECISGGNAVVAGTHESGELIRLVNSDGEIPELTEAEIIDISEIWLEVLRTELLSLSEPLNLPAPAANYIPNLEPIKTQDAAKEAALQTATVKELFEAVLNHWTPIKVFEHFGRTDAGTRKDKDGWVRVLGNGGLFIKGEGPAQFWTLTGATGAAKVPGGGPVQAWTWCESGGARWTVRGHEFVDALKAMAEASSGSILLPAEIVSQRAAERRNGRQPAEPLNPLRQDRWSVAELLDVVLPEPRWSVPGLIPEGVTILGGRPKVGKSWLSLQISGAVGSGGKVFDKDVEQGPVLYIALEDGPRRLQDRIKKLCIPREALITLVRDWPPMHEEGLSLLFDEIMKYNYRLVIIDTLTRAFRGLDQNDQPVISAVMDKVQRMSVDQHMSITFNDHTAKPKGLVADPVNDIMNSTVKTATADMVLALYREQGKAGARLLGRGRDTDVIDLAVHFDPITCCWQCDSDASRARITGSQKEVLEVLKTFGRVQAPTVARALGRDRSYIAKVLNDLYALQKIKRDVVGNNVYYESMRDV
jgi:hypothetical protein